jgi:hypothetical protein
MTDEELKEKSLELIRELERRRDAAMLKDEKRLEAYRRSLKPRAFYKDVRDNIKSAGRMVLCVCPTEGEMLPLAFSYTIGNQAKGLPELLVIGSPRGTYLNEMSERMIKQGKAFDHGEVINTNGKYRIKIINATYEAHENYTIQAGVYFGTQDYKVQQIILSDEEGRLPGEVGCAPDYAAIPILVAG